jgi:hypothetical protein
MMNETVTIREQQCAHPYKRVCWSAIFVGAVVGVGLSFLLNLFSVAIGLTAFTVNKTGAVALAIGGLVGIIIAVVVSMLLAGYVAGYLGRLHCPRRNLGIIYGFTTWCMALILSAIVTSHVSHYVSAYSNATVGSTVVVIENGKTGDVAAIDTNASPANNNQAKISATPGAIASGAFAIFALFFIGAVSACLGACWGMSCRRDD